jgi:hypothetical protein
MTAFQFQEGEHRKRNHASQKQKNAVLCSKSRMLTTENTKPVKPTLGVKAQSIGKSPGIFVFQIHKTWPKSPNDMACPIWATTGPQGFLGFCWFFFFFFLELGFELRALLTKQVLYHLCHASSPFCSEN